MLTGLELCPSRFDRPRQTMQSVGLASEIDRQGIRSTCLLVVRFQIYHWTLVCKGSMVAWGEAPLQM